MFRCHNDSSLLLHRVIYLLYQNPLAFTWHFLHSSVNNSWIFSHISAVTQDMPTNLINLCTKRHNEFLIVPQLVEKAIFDFYTSCGSTHSIEFALQIHKFREHGPGHPLLPLCGNSPCVSRNLYKGRKNVSVGRGFSSRFARKRGFEREAVRKTKFFDSLRAHRLVCSCWLFKV